MSGICHMDKIRKKGCNGLNLAVKNCCNLSNEHHSLYGKISAKIGNFKPDYIPYELVCRPIKYLLRLFCPNCNYFQKINRKENHSLFFLKLAVTTKRLGLTSLTDSISPITNFFQWEILSEAIFVCFLA